METVAFLGLLGLGYLTNKYSDKNANNSQIESFTDSTATVSPGKDKTPKGKPTQPGNPRIPFEYDMQFKLPAGEDYAMEPNPSTKQGLYTDYAIEKAKAVKTVSFSKEFEKQNQGPMPSQTDDMYQPILQTRPDRWEDDTPRDSFVSPLSGIEFKEGEFKHANMVPFFRGQIKQSMKDNVNNQTLDNYTGSGKAMYAKREQTPLFEPTKEPIGNPFGFESTTNFMESRIVEPKNRSGERPVEQIRVGPGINQGFTHLPSGGYQQQDAEEYIIKRMPRTNDLRVDTNPKLTYKQPVVPGSHFITTGGTSDTVGEVRKYLPDTFYINANGERNFVTVGADTKPTIRSVQVLKETTRPETSKEYEGPAVQVEGKATYTVGSTRTPLVKQMGSWGIRNADMTSFFNKNTDIGQNDYGKSGVEIRPNERYYTVDRVHATNLVPDKREVELHLQDVAKATRQEETIANPRPAGNFTALGGNMAEKPTVYDPNDVMRRTIKETTIDNDWLGMAAPSEAQPKLTVYDPDDVMRRTTKETTIDNDWIGMAAPSEAQPKLTVHDPNDVMRRTTKETTIDNDWIGMAAPSEAQPKLTVHDPNDVMRRTTKETTIDNDWIGMAAPSDAQPKLTVHDPNDVMRRTTKETTIDNDWIGMAAPSEAQPKLTVHDPNDVLRTTVKQTTIDNDWIGMVAPSDAQPKLTVHDPNDVLRTTMKQTTIDNDWIGMAAPSEAQPKLTVYDPNDVLRTTTKETTIDNDWIGMAAPSEAQPKLTVHDPNDVMRRTTKETTIDNDWIGMAAPSEAQPKLTVHDPNDVMRRTTKETTIDNDWIGMAAPSEAQPKLTVHDPNDIMRMTMKQTTIDNDWLGMVSPSELQPKLTVHDPSDIMRRTTKETTIDNHWLGSAAPYDAQPKLTVYDPNDVMRTTIRETTEDNDWKGIVSLADSAQKLTVYDPDDIARVTGRNTLKNWDMYRNFGLQDAPGKAETRLQDPVRPTQKAAISAKSSYAGPAHGLSKAEKDRSDAIAMRHYAQKERIARGRTPTSSSVKQFNGEDYVNMQYRKLVADSINDREFSVDRVNDMPSSTQVIGIQRPRTVLKLDIDAERNEPATISSLENNPYVIPLTRSAKVGGKHSI